MAGHAKRHRPNRRPQSGDKSARYIAQHTTGRSTNPDSDWLSLPQRMWVGKMNQRIAGANEVSVLESSESPATMSVAASPTVNHDRTIRWIWIGATLLFVAMVLAAGAAVMSGVDVASLTHYGYPGISLIMFFSSATVLLPAPGFASVLAAGTLVNPWIVGPFAGVGSAVGELTGYLVGMGSREALEKRRGSWWMRAEGWMGQHGFLTVLCFASLPNPFFDAIGVLAGSLGFPVRKMFLACVIGNTVKYTVMALLGSSALNLLRMFE